MHPHIVPEAKCQELRIELVKLFQQLAAAVAPATINALKKQIAQVEAALKNCPDEGPGPGPGPGPQPGPAAFWSSVGPGNVNGRISALAIHPSDGKTLYAGAAAGGVYKTTDGGLSWSTNWANQYSLAMGGLAVAPSNPSVVYAATGEWDDTSGAIYMMYPGVGVYRSSDAGGSWTLLAPIASDQTAAVAVDPSNADRVFVAGNQGVHRSTNGGASWDIPPGSVYGVLDGIISEVMVDPNNVNRIWAGVHDSSLRSGGVWRSLDGGESWSQLTVGIASGNQSIGPRIGLGRNGAHGSSFLAVKMGDRTYTSVDGGDHFTLQSTFNGFGAQEGRGRSIIGVDPKNESNLIAGDVSLFGSSDGGMSWTQLSNGPGATYQTEVHEDLHGIVFDPNDHKHVYVACDNGVYESKDLGQNWKTPVRVGAAIDNGLIGAQCWTVGVSQTATLAYGITTQDNFCYQSSGGDFDYIAYPYRGEGGWILYDPKDENVIYICNWQATGMVKTTNGGLPWQQQTWNELPIYSQDLNSVTMAIAWNNTQWLLAIVKASGAVSRSIDGGASWNSVLAPGVEISAVRFSSSDDNHAYAASVDGRVWHSTDGGASFTELLHTGLPARRVHNIQVDWANPLKIYLAFGTRGALGAVGYRTLWRGDVGNGNQVAWTDVTGNPGASLPDAGLTGLVLDPDHPTWFYVSSIRGIHRTKDGGGTWTPLNEALPNVFVSHLTIRKIDRTLYASTMGRGVFRRIV